MANEVPEKKIKTFCNKFVNYLEKTWVNGKYGQTWNFWMHKGISTNNHAEGYNSKLAKKKKIGKSPNPYVLAKALKEELLEGESDSKNI